MKYTVCRFIFPTLAYLHLVMLNNKVLLLKCEDKTDAPPNVTTGYHAQSSEDGHLYLPMGLF